MKKGTSENINVSEDVDPLASNLNKICKGVKLDGKTFVSKLVKIEGNLLYFQTKGGKIIMNRRDSLIAILPFEKTEAVV